MMPILVTVKEDSGKWGVKIGGKWGQESIAQTLSIQARHYTTLGVA